MFPSGQINSSDYCTQTICNNLNKNPETDSHYKEVLHRSRQSNIPRINLQLFPALPRVVPLTHPTLPKVPPNRAGLPSEPMLATAPDLLVQQTSSLSCTIKWLWVSEEVHIHKNNNTVLWSLKDCSHIYQVLVHMLVKKHLYFHRISTNTHTDFVESLVCKLKC